MTPPSAAAARSRSAAAAAPAPLRQPVAPRRVSGPARHPRAAPRATRQSSPVARLLDAPFLDRLIRGRVWIALVAFALLGIVAMQVAILRLGASIAHSVTEIQHLTQINEAAETTIAQAEPGRNVASEAASLGMVYPPAGNVVYLRYGAGDAASAAASITLPTAPLFTPAAASLTAPIAPTLTTDTTSTTSSTSAGAVAVPSSGPTVSGSSNTAASTTSPGGSVPGAPAAASTPTAVGAGGGSTAPSG
jgi:hypothetical protein